MNILTLTESCPLFQGMQVDEVEFLLQQLQPYKIQYQKNQVIARRGEILSSIGIVLFGSLHIIQDDFWGNRSIVAEIHGGELFGEVYACCSHEELEVSVISSEKTTVLYIQMQQILNINNEVNCLAYRLVKNLLSVLATKNLLLTRKIGHLTKRTTREKILSYLTEVSVKQNSNRFTIPFNRQQLADFLSVDRSAMSKELSKMQSEGMLTYDRNTFCLKTPRPINI